MKSCFGGIIFLGQSLFKIQNLCYGSFCWPDLARGRRRLGRDGKGEAARPEYLEHNPETDTTNFLI
jgi:hypothetical protein